MTIRYLLCPGHVRSKGDGQVHYIPAMTLAHLYSVKMSECVILPGNRTPWDSRARETWLARADLGEVIALRPRYDGDYTLPAN